MCGLLDLILLKPRLFTDGRKEASLRYRTFIGRRGNHRKYSHELRNCSVMLLKAAEGRGRILRESLHSFIS